MKIRTFQHVDGTGKYADLIDWRTVPDTKKSDQKKSSQRTSHSRMSFHPKQKRSGISYNEEESE